MRGAAGPDIPYAARVLTSLASQEVRQAPCLETWLRMSLSGREHGAIRLVLLMPGEGVGGEGGDI